MNTQTISQITFIVSAILLIVGTYKVFEKAGEEVWKAIISF